MRSCCSAGHFDKCNELAAVASGLGLTAPKTRKFNLAEACYIPEIDPEIYFDGFKGSLRLLDLCGGGWGEGVSQSAAAFKSSQKRRKISLLDSNNIDSHTPYMDR